MNPDKLPPGCFNPTIVDRRSQPEDCFQTHDTVHSLSSKWAFLPIEERNKIRKDLNRDKVKSEFMRKFNDFMEWAAGVIGLIMLAVLLLLIFKALLT